MMTLLTGAVLYGAAQAWLFDQTAPVPGIEHSGWFLNSSFGVRVIGRTFMAAGLAVGLFRRSGLAEAALIGAGAVLAMAIVLFGIGPGTIFPIVLTFGTVVLAVATAVGAVAGVGTRWLVRMTLKRLLHNG